MLYKLSIILFFVLTLTVKTQNIEAPIDVQATIFLRILTLERGFEKKISGTEVFKIGIVFQSKFRTSSNVKDELLTHFSRMELVKKGKIELIPIEVISHRELEDYLNKNKLDAVILTPLRTYDLRELSRITRQSKILSLTTIAESVEQGISVGIATRAGKPEIVINLGAARREGAQFSSHLLKLARIIDD